MSRTGKLGSSWRRGLLAGLIITVSAITAAEAQSPRLGGLDTLFGIGLGAVDNFLQEGTCRDLEERMAGAGAGAGLGLLGGVAGGLVGTIVGSEHGTLGIGLGAGLVGFLGNRAGQAAERSIRDFADGYAFELCHLILASNTLKAPLVQRYLQLGQDGCALDPQQMQRMANADWNRLIDCNNGQNQEARDIVLQAMRINQATCFAIEALNRAAVTNEAHSALTRREGSVMPFAPITEPDCDTRSPSEMWQSYLRDRL